MLSFCSQGTQAAAVRICSALCFYMREEVGQAHSHRNVFTGGDQALSGHHNIVVLPLCAEEREACDSVGWDVIDAESDTNQKDFLIQQYVNCYKPNRTPLRLWNQMSLLICFDDTLS